LRESQVLPSSLSECCDELKPLFFCIYQGKWGVVKTMLETLKDSPGFDHSLTIYIVFTHHLLELMDVTGDVPTEREVVSLLSSASQQFTPHQYNTLQTLVQTDDFRSLPAHDNWSVASNRLRCADELSTALRPILSLHVLPPPAPVPNNQLHTLLQTSMIKDFVETPLVEVEEAGEVQEASEKSSPADPSYSEMSPRTLLLDSQTIRCVTYNRSGDLLAVSSNTKSLKIISATSGEVLVERGTHHSSSIYCQAWSPSDQLLATGSGDKTLKLLATSHLPHVLHPEIILSGHGGAVRALCFADELTLCSAGSGDGKVLVWDVKQSRDIPNMQLEGHVGAVFSLHAEDMSLLSGGEDGVVRLWDLRTGCCEGRFGVGDTAVKCVSHVPREEHYIISSDQKGSISLWDARISRSSVMSVSMHGEECRSLDWNREGTKLLSAAFDGTIGVMAWGRDGSLKRVPVNARLKCKILQAKWTPSGNSFVTCGTDRTVTLWS
jgi:WD40 repeat protein